MDKIETKISPAPPNTIASIRAGFDTIVNQIAIIIIPISIDLLLWLGPHLQVKTLVNDLLNSMLSSLNSNSIQSGDLISSSIDVLRSAAAQFNLLSLLRTFPVGIPSLMNARQPLATPNGLPVSIDLSNIFIVICVFIGLVLIGLIGGCFYYLVVVQAALQNKIDIRIILKKWFWASMQAISLALALLILFIVVTVPSSCIISVITLIGLPLGQFGVFLYLGILLWLAFPLLFSAHGIFVNQNNALVSVQRSMALTRLTLPTTSLFFLLILAISEGLNIVWRIPPESSWLTLIGICGHAFITSGLLAASFIYYRDADLWVQETLKLIKSQSKLPIQGS